MPASPTEATLSGSPLWKAVRKVYRFSSGSCGGGGASAGPAVGTFRRRHAAVSRLFAGEVGEPKARATDLRGGVNLRNSRRACYF